MPKIILVFDSNISTHKSMEQEYDNALVVIEQQLLLQ